ncbi:MAG: M23 family metallopeptidase [Lachnospiraceae bacterium]|nr:M23 family metallopeptidase [Lachnospiraceae bacterium]
MSNRDTTILQKLKNNAFYIALGVGLLAVLAVVAVYTLERDNTQVAENEVDLNKASDYSPLTTEDKELVEETNAKTVKRTESTQRSKLKEDLTTEAKTEKVTTEETTHQEETADVDGDDGQIPVTANTGELNFNSEAALSWPVNGEVILPYSMETTVYFKTLDQYQCNPGMLIAAGSGTTVKNAYLGQVTKVTSDNLHGNTVTLYLGNDYSIVYGQLDTIYVKEGDFVKEGQSIGTIGTPTDSFKEEGSHLFFQLLQGDQTIDPVMFIE